MKFESGVFSLVVVSETEIRSHMSKLSHHPSASSPTCMPKPGKGKLPEQTCHVLLVEDHEPTRSALARLLVNRHYKVTSAGSFSEARALIETNDDFGLLISDIGLPDGRGYELMVEFRKKFTGSGIALTGYGRDEDVARSQASGFTTHLTKPVRVESLDHALILAQKCATHEVFVKNGMPR